MPPVPKNEEKLIFKRSESDSKSSSCSVDESILDSIDILERFVPPSDWPKPGEEMDLLIHDCPHDSSDMEWWYMNGHLNGANGKKYSVFASFFRSLNNSDHDQPDGIRSEAHDHDSYSHSLTWGIIDVGNKKYHFDTLLDPNAPAFVSKLLLNNTTMDPLVRTALLEMIANKKETLPLPDRVSSAGAKIRQEENGHFCLNLGGNSFEKTSDGTYHFDCKNLDKGMALKLKFHPQKRAIKQGADGVVSINENQMFYYSITRLEISGDIMINGANVKLDEDKENIGWYDHQYGGWKQDENFSGDSIWNWFACQLENGMDITVSQVFDSPENLSYSYAGIIFPESNQNDYQKEEFKLIPNKSSNWASCRTAISYPQAWTLDMSTAELHLHIVSEFPSQEFPTLVADPAFWEGRMIVEGTYQGKQIKGLGFMELKGYASLSKSTFASALKSVCANALKEFEILLPLQPSYQEVSKLIGSGDGQSTDRYMNGVNLDVYASNIIHPIREITDRGGKAWRTYGMIACIDAVGGESHRFERGLPAPELLHVGSLMIDDIQDQSTTRRGGLCAHLIYGEPTTINSGTSAYFMAVQLMAGAIPGITDAEKLYIYDHFILVLRAAHAGQGLDIHGLDYLMPEVIAKGNAEKLTSALCAIHRLKTGVPIGVLAKVGAKLGGGTDEQAEALNKYFENIGIAFQIMDDVLNLTNIIGKITGEDITAGKITYPIAKAMKLLTNPAERQWLWEQIQAKPTDSKTVNLIIQKLEEIGAIEKSKTDSKKMVDDAWHDLNPHLSDSVYKAAIRAFGLYLMGLFQSHG